MAYATGQIGQLDSHTEHLSKLIYTDTNPQKTTLMLQSLELINPYSHTGFNNKCADNKLLLPYKPMSIVKYILDVFPAYDMYLL